MNYLQEYATEYSKPFRSLKTNRNAAVLLPFCFADGGKPSVLLTVRSNNVFRYRGLICFPGGITDPEDRDATHTALRETHEELGIADGDIEVWGPLHPFPSLGTRILVTPVIGVVRTRSSDILKDLSINTDEVERAFLLSLESLCDSKTWRYTMYSEVKGYRSPVFVVDGLKVWGLTGRLLHLALKGLLAGHYKRDYSFNVFKAS
uniref:Putative peroxisomal nudix hydrolase n=2 Tax=Ornithodoros turicata TaxID=34597 RepID=A0A2R5LGZ5_9ACAR